MDALFSFEKLYDKNHLMVRWHRSLFIVFILFLPLAIWGQKYDTVLVKKSEVIFFRDSLYKPNHDTIFYLPRNADYQVYKDKYVLSGGFYDSVYAKAKKSRVTKELYDFLVVSNPASIQTLDASPIKGEDFFTPFEGKIIKSIRYLPVDLIDGSIDDTTRRAVSGWGKLANDLHAKTRKDVIFKHVLFKEEDKVKPYKLADTERIIRSLAYVQDARIVVKKRKDNANWVDVLIITKDRFPWSFDFTINENGAYQLDLVNQNIFGTGNRFQSNYLYHTEELPAHGYELSYTIRNIEKSFVDASIYTTNSFLGKSVGLTVKRDFLTPRFKYFGDGNIEYAAPIADLTFADSIYQMDFQSRRLSYDLWGARSFYMGDRQNIALAVRVEHDNFMERPQVAADSNELFQDHHFLLGALSYSKLKFLKAKNIIAFNITEDIPVGYLFSVLSGRDWTEFGARDYRGIKGSAAIYSDLGYFYVNYERGKFSRGSTEINRVIQSSFRHFTPLFNVNHAKARIYTRFFYFKGNNLSIPIRESLEGTNRIQNIEGQQIEGDQLMTLSLEYTVFQPWYYYGFRFATYAHGAVGKVSESRAANPFSKRYYNIGGGIRIRNESLAFNTFDLRFGYYPDPPVRGQRYFIQISLTPNSFFGKIRVDRPRAIGFN